MAHISIKDVSKKFNEQVIAVKDLSMEITDGEFLVLLGPSGCGKTTTLRMIAGLENQTSGDIFIGDRLVNDLRAGDRDIAFVFQFYALYPHLSVYDNISFPLRAQQLPKDEVDKRVTDVASRLRIDHLLKKRPGRLPGGEQQRVALGRAMVRHPQVFLMDEPLTNLDAALRGDMRTELKHLQQELATTMVYVTHDQVEAMSMSHRIAVMNLGLLQQIDTPFNIYRHPQTLFVAKFIGSPPMNVVECTVRDGKLLNQSGDFTYRLPSVAAERVINQQRVYFGIRSEDIIITSNEDPDADISGEVLIREPLGDETIYLIQSGSLQFKVKSSPRLRLSEGERVALKINPQRIHLFDGHDERAILQKGILEHV